MKLFLIRHGETVHNVAGVYAGTLDSQLTNFGVEQTHRLGESFAQNNVLFTHIFASPLSRAYQTAQAVQKAQPASVSGEVLEIVRAQELVERDYGAFEGRPFSTRSEWMKTGKDGHGVGSGGVETESSLAKRCDSFLDQYYLPLLSRSGAEEYVVAFVAHGMLLSHLWRRLLLRLPKNSLSIAPEVIEAKGTIIPERLGGWSNTGYLELSIQKDEQTEPEPSLGAAYSGESSAQPATLPTPIPPPLQSEGAQVSVAAPKQKEPTITPEESGMLIGWSTTILAVDSRKHLLGLKRQPGGIGSLAHDQGQKKVDSFFKPLKLA